MQHLSLKDLDSASWTQKVRKILLEAFNNSSLRYLNYDSYAPGKLHHIWASAESNRLDIKKAQVKARLLIGRYNLQASLARYKNISPICKLCNRGNDEL